MIERTNLVTLREIAVNYPVILIDTSAYSHAYFKSIDSKEQPARDLETHKFSGFLVYLVQEGLPLFITNELCAEGTKGNYPYKRVIKLKHVQQDRKILELCREKRRSTKERRDFIKSFKDSERVIQLEPGERNYYQALQGRYGKMISSLGEVDSDVLISGIVSARMRGNTCIVSNDFGIFHCWKSLCRSERLEEFQLGFAVRSGLNSFKMMDLHREKNDHENRPLEQRALSYTSG
jgi:hypothetical protein